MKNEYECETFDRSKLPKHQSSDVNKTVPPKSKVGRRIQERCINDSTENTSARNINTNIYIHISEEHEVIIGCHFINVSNNISR